MLRVLIPEQGELKLAHVVLDLNGTLTDRGALMPDVAWRLQRIAGDMRLHLLTADTYGTANSTAAELGASLHVVASGAAKAAYVKELGAASCVAIGNGANDARMLAAAAIGVAVFGPEGTSSAALAAADIVCRSTAEALDLLLSPLALTATLRP